MKGTRKQQQRRTEKNTLTAESQLARHIQEARALLQKPNENYLLFFAELTQALEVLKTDNTGEERVFGILPGLLKILLRPTNPFLTAPLSFPKGIEQFLFSVKDYVATASTISPAVEKACADITEYFLASGYYETGSTLVDPFIQRIPKSAQWLSYQSKAFAGQSAEKIRLQLQENQLGEAIEGINYLVKNHPTEQEVFVLLGTLLGANAEQKKLSTQQLSDWLLEISRAYLDIFKVQEAKNICNLVLKHDANQIEAKDILEYIQFVEKAAEKVEKKQNKAALVFLKQAIEDTSVNPIQAYWQKILCHEHAKETNDMITSCTALMKVVKPDSKIYQDTLFKKAAALSSLKEFSASNALLTSLAASPLAANFQLLMIKNTIGMADSTENESEKAERLRLAQETLELAVSNPHIALFEQKETALLQQHIVASMLKLLLPASLKARVTENAEDTHKITIHMPVELHLNRVCPNLRKQLSTKQLGFKTSQITLPPRTDSARFDVTFSAKHLPLLSYTPEEMQQVKSQLQALLISPTEQTEIVSLSPLEQIKDWLTNPKTQVTNKEMIEALKTLPDSFWKLPSSMDPKNPLLPAWNKQLSTPTPTHQVLQSFILVQCLKNPEITVTKNNHTSTARPQTEEKREQQENKILHILKENRQQFALLLDRATPQQQMK